MWKELTKSAMNTFLTLLLKAVVLAFLAIPISLAARQRAEKNIDRALVAAGYPASDAPSRVASRR